MEKICAAVCPHCGYDLERDQIIDRDGLRFDPRGDVTWHGMALQLTTNERIVLGTIVKAAPDCVTRAVLDERTGYTGMGNCSEVLVCRIRRKMRDVAPAMIATPLETVRGLGIRWRVAK